MQEGTAGSFMQHRCAARTSIGPKSGTTLKNEWIDRAEPVKWLLNAMHKSATLDRKKVRNMDT